MTNRTNRPTAEALLRAQSLAIARRTNDVDHLHSVEAAIARKHGVVDHQVDVELIAARKSGEFDASPFRATQRFAECIRVALSAFRDARARPQPARDRFDLALTTPTQFLRLWDARRVVDQLNVPYADYLQHAVEWWNDEGRTREPTPGQLTSGTAVVAVLARWMPVIPCLDMPPLVPEPPTTPPPQRPTNLPPTDGQPSEFGEIWPELGDRHGPRGGA